MKKGFLGVMVLSILIIVTIGCSLTTPSNTAKVTSISTVKPTIKPTITPTADIALISSMIDVFDIAISVPNSAGGIDLAITFNNLSAKTIKYITFTVEAYNAVGDAVKDEIKNTSIAECKATGPIKTTQMSTGGIPDSTATWDTVWYNNTIDSAKLLKIQINYMDGTNLDVSTDAINQIEAKKVGINKSTINKEEFDKIEIGMSYEDASIIIGGYGEITYEYGGTDHPYYTVEYYFKGEGNIGAKATLRFESKKLIKKTQLGLE